MGKTVALRGVGLPKCSMYGIFTYIWLKSMVNVGKYSIHRTKGLDFSWFYHGDPSLSTFRPGVAWFEGATGGVLPFCKRASVFLKGFFRCLYTQSAVYTAYTPGISCLLGGCIIPTTYHQNQKSPFIFPRLPNTLQGGIWTPKTHPKGLLSWYLEDCGFVKWFQWLYDDGDEDEDEDEDDDDE